MTGKKGPFRMLLALPQLETQRLILRPTASEDFEDLMLLRECDDAGRVPGAVVGSVDEALDYLRQLQRDNEG